MKNDLSELSWHDALLISVVVDRSNPGHSDTVEYLVEWPNGTRSNIVFNDCYAMHSRMNFGVVAKESIRSYSVEHTGDQIEKIKSAYEKIGAKIDNLKRYCVETNSTGSVIEIFALSVEINFVS